MNDADIPETGAVFTFGRSRFADNIPSHFFIRNDPIVEISCGDQHTAVVCKYGRVFSFGSNEWGQLGLGHKDSVNKPSCVKSLKPEKIKHVACGRVHTVFTTENGKIYSCGCNTDGQLGIGDNEMLDYVALPMFVTELEEEIIQVSAGSQHSAVLTGKGTVYVWGSNTDGQLGLMKSNINIYTDPTQLNIPYTIVRIDCGYYHTGFISDSGDLLLCGNCENGKLGIKDDHQKEQWLPTTASIPGKTVSVACGGHHTIALTDDGRCYVCGDNTYGQLGIDGVNATVGWLCLESFGDILISSIAAGESHSMFMTETGILYACGDAKYGKLCLNDIAENSVTKPLKVTFPVTTLKLNMVVCGGCHTMVMASPNTPTNKLSTIKETKAAPKINKDFFFSENQNNNSSKIDQSPAKNLNISHYNTIDQLEEKRSLSFTTDIDRNSFEDVSPNIEKTCSLRSEEPEARNANGQKPVNGIELQKIDEIKTEVSCKNTENKSQPQNMQIISSFVTNEKPEGRFKKLLRQIGLRKIVESKNENDIPLAYNGENRGSQERRETGETNTKPEGNRVTSKVCTIF